MKPDFVELIREHNGHSTFLNMEGMVKAMKICYETGKNHGSQQVLDWMSQMEHLSDNINYIKEEWENQNKNF